MTKFIKDIGAGMLIVGGGVFCLALLFGSLLAFPRMFTCCLFILIAWLVGRDFRVHRG